MRVLETDIKTNMDRQKEKERERERESNKKRGRDRIKRVTERYMYWLTLTKMRTLVSPILYLPSETLSIGNWVGH